MEERKEQIFDSMFKDLERLRLSLITHVSTLADVAIDRVTADLNSDGENGSVKIDGVPVGSFNLTVSERGLGINFTPSADE